MDIYITDLVEAIEISRGDMQDVEAEYNNAFPPGSLNRDIMLDIAIQELKQAHSDFDSLWNNHPLRMDAGVTMNEFLVRLGYWREANKGCRSKRKTMMRRYLEVFRSLYGVEEQDSALGITMRRLGRAHWYFNRLCTDTMQSIDSMIAGLAVGFNANAVQPPVPPPAPPEEMVEGNSKTSAPEPVLANVLEEHSMAAIPEPEDTVEGNSNTSGSEETVENN